MASASAYFTITETNETIRFSGVTAVRHNHALQTETEIREEDAENVVNGARTLPSRVILSVVESDAEHASGWSARLTETLERIRKERLLCTLVTPLKTYALMLLTEFTLVRDDQSPCGFTGTLAFTEYVAPKIIPKEEDNSSAVTNTGSAAPPATASSDPKAGSGSGSSGSGSSGTKTSGGGAASPLRPILLRAGIALD